MTAIHSADALAAWNEALIGTYPTPPLEVVAGHGATLVDAQGREHIDMLAGIAVNSLGYGHPRLVEAVSAQVARLQHSSNLLANSQVVRAARRLVAKLPGAKAFFCNSGTEANEAALKLTRTTGRTRVLAASHGFHGRTMGSLTLTGQPAKRDIFAPLAGTAEFFPFGDLDYLRHLVEMNPEATAGIILEPIQGETGVVPAPEGFLRGVRELCDEHGILLVLDEVQTGVGRTGTFFAFEQAGIVPDIVTLAKGLGGGIPVGAMLARGPIAAGFGIGDHGTTFGGNPVACAAVNVVLDEIDDAFLARVRRRGEELADALRHIDGVTQVRGAGLMLGVVLAEPVAKQVVEAGCRHGVVLNAPADDVLRLVPPLVIAEDELRQGIDRIAEAIREARHGE